VAPDDEPGNGGDEEQKPGPPAEFSRFAGLNVRFLGRGSSCIHDNCNNKDSQARSWAWFQGHNEGPRESGIN